MHIKIICIFVSDPKSGKRYSLPEFDDPAFDIFTWYILQNRKEMSLVFWEQSKVI